MRAGRPYRIVVTHFGDQRAKLRGRVDPAARTSGHGVVAISAGPGMTALLEEAGAVVVPAPPGRRPSSGELLDAVRRTGAAEVAVLPHHRDLVPVAQTAAEDARAEGLRVAVIPTTAAGPGPLGDRRARRRAPFRRGRRRDDRLQPGPPATAG